MGDVICACLVEIHQKEMVAHHLQATDDDDDDDDDDDEISNT